MAKKQHEPLALHREAEAVGELVSRIIAFRALDRDRTSPIPSMIKIAARGMSDQSGHGQISEHPRAPRGGDPSSDEDAHSASISNRAEQEVQADPGKAAAARATILPVSTRRPRQER